jgi:membrane protease YdiL (CAAX protease family)
MNSTTNTNPNTSFLQVFTVLISRTVLLVLAYFFTAWLFLLFRISVAYEYARVWWPLMLIIVNIIVLALLFISVKREGLTLASLIRFEKSKFRKDVISSLWIIPTSIVLAVVGTFIFGLAIYQTKIPSDMTSLSILPTWALIISLIVHPLVNAFVEEMTYNGYVFPRFQGFLHSSWLTVILVTFFFSLQHIAIPLIFDIKFMLWRFLSFVPLLLFWVLIYKKMCRLTSLIIVHWFMDVFGIISIMFMPSP